MFGAKLSWCQIVRCQIVLVPNCPGAKLSTFIILVPNCPLLLSWCQIVPFIILVPNCPVPNCPVPNCPVLNCPTITEITIFFRLGGAVIVGWRGQSIKKRTTRGSVISNARFLKLYKKFLKFTSDVGSSGDRHRPRCRTSKHP